MAPVLSPVILLFFRTPFLVIFTVLSLILILSLNLKLGSFLKLLVFKLSFNNYALTLCYSSKCISKIVITIIIIVVVVIIIIIIIIINIINITLYYYYCYSSYYYYYYLRECGNLRSKCFICFSFNFIAYYLILAQFGLCRTVNTIMNLRLY